MLTCTATSVIQKCARSCRGYRRSTTVLTSFCTCDDRFTFSCCRLRCYSATGQHHVSPAVHLMKRPLLVVQGKNDPRVPYVLKKIMLPSSHECLLDYFEKVYRKRANGRKAEGGWTRCLVHQSQQRSAHPPHAPISLPPLTTCVPRATASFEKSTPIFNFSRWFCSSRPMPYKRMLLINKGALTIQTTAHASQYQTEGPFRLALFFFK